MFGSCVDCLWELGSNFLLLLTRYLEQKCRSTTEMQFWAKSLPVISLGVCSSAALLGRNSLVQEPRAAFLSLGDIYLILKISMLQKETLLFFLRFYLLFPLFFSFMGQMGFSLDSLFTALAAAECPEHSFHLSPPQV